MPQVVEVNGFKFMPMTTLMSVNVMRALGDHIDGDSYESAGAFQQEVGKMVEQNSPTMGGMFNMVNLAGEWPPAPDVVASLGKVTQMLEDVEKKAGVTFQRTVGITPGDTGMFMLDHTHSIHIDYSAAKGKFPPYEHLKNIMFHEASHAYYGDNASQAPLMGAISCLAPTANALDLYQHDKGLFEKLLTHQFESLDQFEDTLKTLSQGVNNHLSPLARVASDVMQQTGEQILADMYGAGKIEAALREIPAKPEQSLLEQMIKLQFAFPIPTQEQQRQGRENIAAITKQDVEKGKTDGELDGQMDRLIKQNIEFFTSGEPHFALTESDRARVDQLMQKYMVPMHKQMGEIVDFTKRFSLAFERRADDFMVANSDDPHTAPETLALLDKIDRSKYAMLPQAQEQESLNAHDSLDARVARARKVAEFITEVRTVKGKDADVLTALRSAPVADFDVKPALQRADGKEWTGSLGDRTGRKLG